MIPNLRPSAKYNTMRSRELDFNNTSQVVPLPEYKPMFDVHLKHMWLNPHHKGQLQTAGFLDEAGAPVDVDQHRRKLYVIEQELAQADAVERNRAMEKERRLRDRQVLAKRQEVHEKHLRQVHTIREERRRKRDPLNDTSRSLGSQG